MKTTRNDVSDTIRTVTEEWIAGGRVPDARSIGDGSCEEFAEEVFARLKAKNPDTEVEIVYGEDWWARAILDDGTPDPDNAEAFVADIPRLRAEGAPLPDDVPEDELANLIGSATHVWLKFEGLHHDASGPEGAKHFLLLPFFADQIAGLRAERSSRARPDSQSESSTLSSAFMV